MPELPGTPQPMTNPDRMAQPQTGRPPQPGMPIGLEALSPAERGWWGRRFGIDTPYTYTLSGFGETVPVLNPTDADFPLFAAPPTGEPPVQGEGELHICDWDGGPPQV